MTSHSEVPLITFLPAQLCVLAALPDAFNRGAIGIIKKEGSSILVDTGQERFWMDAQGKRIENEGQEEFAC